MNDSLIRKFCESRHRWPIVATATLLVALATLVPSVDDYCDKQSSRSDLSDKLESARRTAQELPKFEARVATVSEEVGSLDRRAIGEANLASYRSRLVDVVRESGCQIRRIEVGAPTIRAWKQNDRPLDEQPNQEANTPFSLERRSVTLAVDGAMPAVYDLLDRLERERTISHPHRVQLQAVSGDGETVTLELELWLFAISRTAA